MSEQTEPNQIAATDINAEFDANVSLKTIIGSPHAVSIAKAYIDQYYNDIADGRNPLLTPILLVGQSGMSTFARAISNSFANLHFKSSHSHWFSGGVQDLNRFFYFGNYGTTFYISAIDTLNIMSQYMLWKILSNRRLNVNDYETKIPINAPLLNNLHIFSAKNTDNLTEPLLAQFPVKIFIGDLTRDELFYAIKQRATLLKLSYENDQVLFNIAIISGKDINMAMELLSLGMRLMRSNNEIVLTSKIMNTAFLLADANLKIATKKQLK